MKIKVLLVSCWFPSLENPQQGSFVLDHAKSLSLASIDCQVLFIHIHGGNQLLGVKHKSYSIEKTNVSEINIQSYFWKLLYQFPLLLKQVVLNHIDAEIIQEVDVIHSHAIFPAGIFGWQLAQKYHKPFVITEHWSRAISFLRKHPLGFLGKKIYENADALIFVSESLKKKVLQRIKPRPVFIIPNPVDGKLFYYRPKPKQAPIRCTLIAIWKKSSPKRGDIVLDAFNLLQKEPHIPFQLDFVGEGDALKEYKEKAKDYGLPVCFCGYEKKEALAERLQKSHFLFHPTEFETFGIVVFEALKTGTPVLVSDIDVFRPYIHHGNGILVKNTVEDWKKALATAFKRYYNYENIAVEYKVPFSEPEVASKTRKVYEKVITKSRMSN